MAKETAPVAYAALLRGINVGGHGKVPMAELRKIVEGLGHSGVRTYLNSGNVVFFSREGDEEELAAGLEKAIAAHFGFDVPCLVRSCAYLREVADANPYAEAAAANGKLVHATFLSGPAEPERFAGVKAADFAPEEYALGDRVVYMHLPNGLGRSKLAEALARPSVLKGVTGTSRNWNTVVALLEMSES